MNRSQTYRKFSKCGSAVACVVGLLAGTLALAANPNVRFVEADVRPDEVDISGRITGLGNEDVLIEVELSGTITDTCRNKGENLPPGQQDLDVNASFPFDPDDFTKNGNLNFTVSVDIPPSGNVDGAPDCPNGKNWTQRREVDIDEAIVTISQGGDEIGVFSCDFDGSTATDCDEI